MTIVEMNVHMDCPGCESKIKKALQKLPGVDDIDIDMRMQKVTVTGCADQRKVLKTVRRTGRTAELWPFPYNPEYHGYINYYYDQNLYRHDQGNPTTYYNQNRYGYHSDPSTYYNQNHYEYQNVLSTNYNQNDYEYQNELSSYDHHYMSQPAASTVSSYNYHVHGYNGHDHGYYREPPHSTILDEKARAMFSDDNTNACSIM